MKKENEVVKKWRAMPAWKQNVIAFAIPTIYVLILFGVFKLMELFSK